jgi:hypothetical protein
MSWEDFCEQFTDLSINHLINTSVFSFSKTWKEVIMVIIIIKYHILINIVAESTFRNKDTGINLIQTDFSITRFWNLNFDFWGGFVE